MLDLKYVRANMEAVKTALANRNQEACWPGSRTWKPGAGPYWPRWRELRHKRNEVSGTIAGLKREGKDASALMADMKDVSSRIKDLETGLHEKEEGLNDLLMRFPTSRTSPCPWARMENDNVEVKKHGTPTIFNYEPAAHWTIGEGLGNPGF